MIKNAHRKNLLLVCLLIAIGMAENIHGQTIENSPVRIILNITEEPAASISVSWASKKKYLQPRLEYAEATGGLEYLQHIQPIKDINIICEEGIDSLFHYSGRIKKLKPGVLYYYRAGGDSALSEWNSFKTAHDDIKPFEFVYLGDPQHGFTNLLPGLFRSAYRQAPRAGFWLITGDLLDRPKYDYQWSDCFNALGYIPAVVPFVLAAGNHEYTDDETEINTGKRISKSWLNHFLLPDNGIEKLSETNYYFDYQGIKIIVLNGNEYLTEQALWLDDILSKNKCKWVIVSLHQPLYSMGKKRDQQKTRNAFMEIFDKYNVDLVLQGHDHVYARSNKLKNGTVVKDNEPGTVYVTSNSGSDYYQLHDLYLKLMAKTAIRKQLFQVVSLEANHLKLKTFTSDGKLFDNLELRK